MRYYISIALLISLALFPITAFAGTIPGFEAGGHYYSQAGNPNPAPIANGSNNYWCTVACLHMLFDYWDSVGNAPGIYPGGLAGGNMQPQEEIAWAVNVNDALGVAGAPGNLYAGGGTYNGTRFGDDRRGGHFSFISAAGPVVQGYSWESRTPIDLTGYSAMEGDWTALGGTIPQLQAFVDAAIPLIIDIMPFNHPVGHESMPYPPETMVGHSLLLIGYHDDPSGLLLEFHDPWHGPNVLYRAATFFNNVWPFPGGQKPFLFAAPWDRVVTISAPSQVIVGDNFTVTVGATYMDGLPPLGGLGAVIVAGTDNAALGWGPDAAGLALHAGQTDPASLGGTITLPGTSGSASFSMDAVSPGSYSFLSLATVVVAAASPSFTPFYIDVIGGRTLGGSLTVVTTTTTSTTSTTASPTTTTTTSPSTTTTTVVTTTSTTSTTGGGDDDSADDDTGDDDIVDDTGDDTSTDDTIEDDTSDDTEDDTVGDDSADDDTTGDDTLDDDTEPLGDDTQEPSARGGDDDSSGGCCGC